MKSQTARSRRRQPARGKRAQTAPLGRMLVTDALRTWVFPSAAVAAAFTVFVIYNVGLVEEAFAVTTVGLLALAVILFYGLRGFAAQRIDGVTAALLIGFGVLWIAATVYPFYRAVNPGTPLFSTELARTGGPVTVPVHGKSGHLNMVVEGHFLPSSDRMNRTATYAIALTHDGSSDRILEGTFSQTWGEQRIGAGRRSSMVPVMNQTVQVLHPIDDTDGHDLILKLTELSPGVRNAVTVRVYTEGLPQLALVLLSILTIAAALVIDAWRPKGDSEGLMVMLAVATAVAVATFRTSTQATPGFPQLVIAALMGTLAGAIGGSVVWRATQPLRRYLVRRR
jgi:hypothetical protein